MQENRQVISPSLHSTTRTRVRKKGNKRLCEEEERKKIFFEIRPSSPFLPSHRIIGLGKEERGREKAFLESAGPAKGIFMVPRNLLLPRLWKEEEEEEGEIFGTRNSLFSLSSFDFCGPQNRK